MKMLLMTFLIILLTTYLFSQKVGDKILVTEETDLYTESSIMAKSNKLAINDTINILEKENERGYYYVGSKYGKGYINSTKIVQFVKFQNPKYKKSIEDNKAWKESRINEMDTYISRYGEPSSSSEYKTDDYVSRTLIWHCAGGKYRSMDFEYKNGNWTKTSEYTSDCI